jgi:hypothetical protein
MKKKVIAAVLVLTLVSLFAIAPAEAGSKIRQSWQGAGIALGALLLGGLVVHQMATQASPPQVVYAPPPELHYDGRGHWVAGHYINREAPGYYEERRVWVEGYYRQR